MSSAGTGPVPELCRHTTVRNGPFPAVYDTIEWLDPAQTTLVVFHLARAAGEVSALDGLAEIRALPTYHDSSNDLAVGDRIELTKDVVGSVELGFVVLAGSDRTQLWRDYERIRLIEHELFGATGPAPSSCRDVEL